MSSVEGRLALGNLGAQKSNMMLGRSDLSDLFKPEISDAWIQYFNNQTNFEAIFK